MPLKGSAIPINIKTDSGHHPWPGTAKADYASHLKTSDSTQGVDVAYDPTQVLSGGPVEGTATVKTSHKGVITQETNTSLEAHPGVFVTKPGALNLEVKGSRTLNLGNYNSASVAITLSVPCDAVALESAYDWASNWVSEKIESEISSATGQVKE